ncbi:MAG: hypothetical protein K0Q95_2313 [Bacteroidota bacterium]|jgi:hypothetical protein|nr:hypothetical protein [Bacteroidota bacterium]
MKILLKLSLFYSFFIGVSSFAQNLGPYSIRHSEEFPDTKGLPLSQTTPCANGDVLLTFSKGEKLDKIGLQLFNADLKLVNSTIPEVKSLFTNKRSYFERLMVLNNKSYIFVREPMKETKTEVLSAVEFSRTSLNTAGSTVKLFESSRGIIGGGMGYSSSASNDKSKVFFKYNLINKERKDIINKAEYGFYMFDENLKQIWGGEYTMPYTEAKMSTVDFQVSNDGKLYYLIRVYDVLGREAESHFEILVYEKTKKDPKIIQFAIDEYTPRSTYLYEDKTNNIVVAGFYSKKKNPSIDGAFMVKLDAANGKFSKLGGGYYEIPSELIKTFMTDRQKERIEKKEKKSEGNDGKDLGISDLQIESVHFLENGSTVIVSEIYFVVATTTSNGKTTTTTYNTYANDIFVFCIDKGGKLSYIRKIPKRQHEGGAAGNGISISSTVKGNDVHIFYLDNLDNFTIKEDEAPKVHQSRRGGFIAAVNIDEKGNVKKFNLGEAEQFETNLYMRKFKNGRKNNMVAVERKKKKNMLFSLDIK